MVERRDVLTWPNLVTVVRLCCIPIFLWLLFGRDDRLAASLLLVPASALAEGPTLKPMLRPDLPKENVDGEAVEWAASRLRQRPQRTKILLVLSDGAPVDDSTLQVNHSHILEDHVIAVVRALEESSDIRVAAIGIGFDVSRYYVNASTVKVPEDLGVAVIDQLERLLLPPQSAMPGEAET